MNTQAIKDKDHGFGLILKEHGILEDHPDFSQCLRILKAGLAKGAKSYLENHQFVCIVDYSKDFSPGRFILTPDVLNHHSPLKKEGKWEFQVRAVIPDKGVRVEELVNELCVKKVTLAGFEHLVRTPKHFLPNHAIFAIGGNFHQLKHSAVRFTGDHEDHIENHPIFDTNVKNQYPSAVLCIIQEKRIS